MRTKEKFMRVGELAKEVGKTVRALHLYEEMGLLKPVSRSAGGYRLYTEDAIARVNWISRLGDLGFSLPDVQGFLRDWEEASNGPAGMARVRSVFEAKLAETRDVIARMQDLERDLQASLSYLELCGGCAPTHAHGDCAGCSQPGHQPDAAPDLVAGLARPARRIDVPVTHLRDMEKR
jgi:MerR family transcriptional regulator, copper efflux regulator